ncbi:MAG: outer membrane protein transport protein [Deltaproteobacteria bacterium]|nr:outer membrane protein transport protein [Deltaproteobacteria bacterium]
MKPTTFFVFAALMLHGAAASAGGLEMPDQGAEAVGRGGAFTAKADNATAVHYNVAGLAQQRGTRAYLGSNASTSSTVFRREGTYADDPNNPATPWGGRAYPAVDNEGGMKAFPFLAVTSDFGLESAAFALAVHTPPASNYAGRVYPLVVNGMPSPARYDQVGGGSSSLIYYTGAAGFRLGSAVDLGVAVTAVSTRIQTRSVSYLDAGSACGNGEFHGCDGRAEGEVSGWTATGAIGLLARLGDSYTLGAHVRGPVMIDASGQSASTAPTALGGQSQGAKGFELRTALPVVARLGLRKAFPGARGEIGDIEIDATYERWSDAQSPGPRARFEMLATTPNAQVTQLHNYNDTFSLRLGGAYNVPVGDSRLSFRGGAFYDSTATPSAWTRLDADTLAKIATTLGVGAKVGSFRFDVAYAAVFDVSRTVTDGQLRPVNALKGGASVDATGKDLPVVNNGSYSGFTHLFSAAVVVELDYLFGFGRGATPKFGGGPVVGSR